MLPHDFLPLFKSQLDFQPLGDIAGNLTLGRGKLAGRPAHVAIIEARAASGALGVRECDKLASLFTIVAAQRGTLVLFIDSAGAKVSEGLPALGAFRHMYRAALAAAASGAEIIACLGANCFGGASMLAALAGTRFYCANSRLAMSGPAILAQAAGVSVLDEMFQAMSQAALGAEARGKLGLGNVPVTADSLRGPLPAAATPAVRHAALGERLPAARPAAEEPIARKDLDKLYPGGYTLAERQGVSQGEATHAGRRVALLGLIGGRPLGAAHAWQAADRLWALVQSPPAELHLLVDCESHAASLEDERIMLSAYLADLAQALHALAAAGTRVETVVLGKLGGGVYVAVAAPVAEVVQLYGAEVQLLPGKAIASILGESDGKVAEFAEVKAARVADRELKLGLV